MELFIFFMKTMQCSLNRPSPRVAMMVEMKDNDRQTERWPKLAKDYIQKGENAGVRPSQQE